MNISSIVLFCALYLFSLCNAAIYLSPTGNDSNDGKSPESAKRTLQGAVSALGDDDTILAHQGQYTVDHTIDVNKGFELHGHTAGQWTPAMNCSFNFAAGAQLRVSLDTDAFEALFMSNISLLSGVEGRQSPLLSVDGGDIDFYHGVVAWTASEGDTNTAAIVHKIDRIPSSVHLFDVTFRSTVTGGVGLRVQGNAGVALELQNAAFFSWHTAIDLSKTAPAKSQVFATESTFNTTAAGTDGFAIVAGQLQSLTLERSVVSGWATGVYAHGALYRSVVSNNHFIGNGIGLKMDGGLLGPLSVHENGFSAQTRAGLVLAVGNVESTARVTLLNSHFVGNNGTAAVHCSGDHIDLIVSSCEFQFNRAASPGAALAIQNGVRAKIDNNLFNSNQCMQGADSRCGGAISCSASASLHFAENQFAENRDGSGALENVWCDHCSVGGVNVPDASNCY